jgi:hypothetical protein
MGTNPPPYAEPPFEPTAKQLQRDRQLQRRNRLYIYLPLSIVSLIAIVLIVLILIGIFAPGIQGTAEFISAVADIIVILWIMPAMIFVSILPITYIAYLFNRRQKRKLDPQTGPLAYRSRIQILLWRIQVFIDQVEATSDQWAPKIAEPFINFNARIAGAETRFENLIRPTEGNSNHDRYGNGNAEYE